MDKLELDARVAHLERKVAILSVIIAVMGAAALLSMLTFTRRAEIQRAEPHLSTPTVMTTPRVPAPPPIPVGTHSVGVVDYSEGGVPYLANQLRESWTLQAKGLLNSSEFAAKKAQLLAKQIRPGSLTSDLEQISQLQRENILSSSEYATLKAKILEISK